MFNVELRVDFRVDLRRDSLMFSSTTGQVVS
jgi:hypothetical protein